MRDYRQICDEFRWELPQDCNMAADVCLRHAEDDVALIHPRDSGEPETWHFGDFARESAKLANALSGLGMKFGARLAVLMGQRPETATSHLAAWRGGMISVPLFILFGPDALTYRLSHSGAETVITDRAGLARLAEADLSESEVARIIAVDADKDGVQNGIPVLSWRKLLESASDSQTPAATTPDTPALIIYTSGTTGAPKGAVHGHRVLRGHLPGVCLPHNFFPQKDDCFWTPADWAWIGGLLDVLMPSWYYGVPVVSYRAAKFDPEQAMFFMAKHRVRNVFMPPTALRLMRAADAKPPGDLTLRSIGSGGETLGAEMLEWGRATFGTDINEFYGQTECNLIIGNCAELSTPRAGMMGRAIPGHRIAAIDEDGQPLPDGEEGEVAAHRGGANGDGDPVMFLGYWGNSEATAKKFRGSWLCTGDRARRDKDGFWTFVGRDDDVISSGGYRIGPGEIEDCLTSHPSVSLAGVVGVEDDIRGQVIKAVVVPSSSAKPGDDLAEALRIHVKTRLAAHESPRIIVFAESLPLTATGKIKRAELRSQHRAETGQNGD